MMKTITLLSLIGGILISNCTPEPSCEADQWGYLNVNNRTRRAIHVEVNKTGHLIEANDSVTIFEVPAGMCEIKGYDGFDTIRHVTEIRACLVTSVGIKYD